jgi:hypothetical protein
VRGWNAATYGLCNDWTTHYYDTVDRERDKNGLRRANLEDEICELRITELRRQVGRELERGLFEAGDMCRQAVVLWHMLLVAAVGARLDFTELGFARRLRMRRNCSVGGVSLGTAAVVVGLIYSGARERGRWVIGAVLVASVRLSHCIGRIRPGATDV